MQRLVGALSKDPQRARPMPQRGPTFRAQPQPQMLPTEQSDLTAGYDQGTMQPMPNRNMPMSPAQQQQIAQMQAVLQQNAATRNQDIEANPYAMPRPGQSPWGNYQRPEPGFYAGGSPQFDERTGQYMPLQPMPGRSYNRQPTIPQQPDRFANMHTLPSRSIAYGQPMPQDRFANMMQQSNIQQPKMAFGQTSLRKM